MQFARPSKALLAGLLAGVLIGGGITAVSPAGAAVSGLADTVNWKQIWKKKIKPRADKRYYTKKASKQTFATKAEVAAVSAALSAYVTKTDLATALGDYYTKAQSDAKYAPASSLLRGVFHMTATSGANNDSVGADISYGVNLSAAPTAHYIMFGAPVPSGCSGSATAPDASPGHLCVFESYTFGSLSGSTQRGITALDGNASNIPGSFGAGLYAFTTGTGNGRVIGSWALRPGALLAPAAVAADSSGPSGPTIDQP